MVTRVAPDKFKAVADETRRDILRMLADQPMAVHAVAARFEMSRPAVSKHLRILGDAGLISAGRAGKENVYALREEAFEELADWLSGFWRGRLALLKRLAEGDG